MRLGIKGKQVLGVTTIVGAIVVVLSVMHLARLAQVRLDESRARAELLANAIFHRARRGRRRRRRSLRGAAQRFGPAIDSRVEPVFRQRDVRRDRRHARARSSRTSIPRRKAGRCRRRPICARLMSRSAFSQLSAIYSGQGGISSSASRCCSATPSSDRFGSASRRCWSGAIWTSRSGRPRITALIALGVSMVGAMVLAQLLLRPIHVIRSGLTRLGRGEFGVRLDLDQQDEFGELGTFFNTVSAQLSADRTQMAGQVANLESAVEHLEDAVAIVSPQGPGAVCESRDARADSRLRRRRVARRAGGRRPSAAAAGRSDAGQPAVARPDVGRRWLRPGGEPGERLLLTHPVNDANGDLVGIMLIVRNLRVSEPGAVDRALLAEARRARPAVGGRRARGEEPAERDDDSPGAAAAAGGAARRPRPVLAGCRRHRRSCAAAAAGRIAEALAARGRHCRRDSAARRSRAGIPEVHASRGSQAAAGRRSRCCSTRSCRSCGRRPTDRRRR